MSSPGNVIPGDGLVVVHVADVAKVVEEMASVADVRQVFPGLTRGQRWSADHERVPGKSAMYVSVRRLFSISSLNAVGTASFTW